MRVTFIILWLALPALAAAQSAPDMSRQDAWGDAEKQQFLRYLKAGGAAPVSGSVKEVSVAAGELAPVRKARFATLSWVEETTFAVAPGGAVRSQGSAFGPRLLVGGHLFSWVRYYAGAQYASFDQDKLDGTRAKIGHAEFPFGVELALIPLGTPHTRYVLLRGGVTAHRFSSSADASAFESPLIGWQGSWNLGLGYEWQITDTNWRVHLLAEGSKSFVRDGGSRFYGAGFSAGLVRTF